MVKKIIPIRYRFTCLLDLLTLDDSISYRVQIRAPESQNITGCSSNNMVQIFTWIEDTWSNIVQICPGALFIREIGLNLWSKIYVNLIRSITDAP